MEFSIQACWYFLCSYITSAFMICFLDWVIRAHSTIQKLKVENIPILNIGWDTIGTFISRDTQHFFHSLMKDLKKGRSLETGIAGWLTPVGKPFLVIHSQDVLEQVIVKNQKKLTKFHAHGLLEVFRKTTLRHEEAWKIVHKIASRFPIKDQEFQQALKKMVDRFLDEIQSKNGVSFDFADFTREFYWELVIFLVLGEPNTIWDKSIVTLYKETWESCLSALNSPIGHVFPFYMQLPIPTVIRYHQLAKKLRKEISEKIISIRKKPDLFSRWCVLSVIRNEMDIEDQLEVAMEFIFTGASSVTTTLSWLVWNLAISTDYLQEKILEECKDNELSMNGMNKCLILDAVLRETLRLYSPIHIGRLSLEPFEIVTKKGEIIRIPKGTDIFSNMWFIHRDPAIWDEPDKYDYKRFLNKRMSVPGFHPFSMGMRSCPGYQIAFSIIKFVVSNLIFHFEIRAKCENSLPKFDCNLMLPVTPIDMMINFRKR